MPPPSAVPADDSALVAAAACESVGRLAGSTDEILVGGLADEILVGGLADEILVGGLADEILVGGLADEILVGGLADETLVDELASFLSSAFFCGDKVNSLSSLPSTITHISQTLARKVNNRVNCGDLS